MPQADDRWHLRKIKIAWKSYKTIDVAYYFNVAKTKKLFLKFWKKFGILILIRAISSDMLLMYWNPHWTGVQFVQHVHY
jgi:hypothetical protein